MSFSISHAIDIAIQTFTALYAGASVKGLVLLLSLLLCFAGYRLMRWSSALYGVVSGVVLGICVTGLIPAGQSQVNGLVQSVLAMVIGGVVVGALAFLFKQVGIFLICGWIGILVSYIPATFIQEFSSMGFWCVLLGCALLFGVTGVLFLKPAYLVATGLSGIPAGFALTGLLGVFSLSISMLLGCGLAIVGCVVQLYLLRRMEETEELALQHTMVNLPVVSEEEDDIDRISNRVAEHIGITNSYQNTEFPASDEPETVDDRTMMISEIAEPFVQMSEETAAVKESQEQTEGEDETVQVAALAAENLPEDIQEEANPVISTSEMERSTDTEIPSAAQTLAQSISGEDAATMSEILERFASVTSDDVLETKEQQPAVDAEAVLDDESKSSELSEQTADLEEDLPPETTPEQGSQTMSDVSDKRSSIEIKRIIFRWVMPAVLIVAALAFARIGIMYVELLLTLCFVGYVVGCYRSVTFACAVLCVRRAIDLFGLVVSQAHWISVVLSSVSCLCFLILTIAALSRVRGALNTTKK